MREILVEAVKVVRALLGAVDAVKVWVIKVGDNALVVTPTVEDAEPCDDQSIVLRPQESLDLIHELF